MEKNDVEPVYLRKGMYHFALVLALLLGADLLSSFFLADAILPAFILIPFVLLLILALVLSLRRREYDGFDSFWRQCRRPLVALSVLLLLAAFFNLVISVFVMEGGSPVYRDGTYLLVSHGTVLRRLTEEEFLRFRRVEARLLICPLLTLSVLGLSYFSGRISAVSRE